MGRFSRIGLPGLLILFGAATTHSDFHKNENLLVFPFPYLSLLGPGLLLMLKEELGQKTNRRLRLYLIVCLLVLGICLLLKLGPLVQQNYRFIAFAAVLNAASLLSLRMLAEE